MISFTGAYECIFNKYKIINKYKTFAVLNTLMMILLKESSSKIRPRLCHTHEQNRQIQIIKSHNHITSTFPPATRTCRHYLKAIRNIDMFDMLLLQTFCSRACLGGNDDHFLIYVYLSACLSFLLCGMYLSTLHHHVW